MTKVALRMVAIGLGLAALACEGTISNPGRPTTLDGAPPTDTGSAGSPAATLGATEPVVRLMDLVQVGTSRLVRTPNGISFTLSTSDLTPGHAYTLWFVAFNEPAQCAVPNECAPDDVVNDAAKPDMMYATGGIVGGAGTATFAGRRAVGDTSGSLNSPVGLPAYGLLDAFGAEIHLAVHDHGPKLPEYLPDMIQTVDGGCTDAGIPAAGVVSPWNQHPFGRRGPNTCATIQATVHRP
jgi:hypothetical protein